MGYGRGVWRAVNALALVAMVTVSIAPREGACWSTKDWYPHVGRGPTFAENAFVSVDMGTSGMEGKVMALGDMDGDSYTDVFVVSKGSTKHALDTVRVYRWDYWLYQFVAFPLVEVKEEEIRNVIPGDFNGDGRMDLLIQGGSSEGFVSKGSTGDAEEDDRAFIDSHLSKEGIHWHGSHMESDVLEARDEGTLPYLRLYFGDYNSFDEPLTLPLASNLQVYDVLASAVDMNGDTAVDLFLQRTYWVNGGTGETWRVVTQGEGEELGIPPIAQRHSNAFADMTGDCFPDLILFADQSSDNLKNSRKSTKATFEEDSASFIPFDSLSDSTTYGEEINTEEYSLSFAVSESDLSEEYLPENSTSSVFTESSEEELSTEEIETETENNAEENEDGEYTENNNGEGLEEDGDTVGDPRQMEVWTFADHAYGLERRFSLPQGTGRTTFADVDGDGALDVLFTECKPAPSCSRHNKVHIVFNLQANICEGVSSVASKDCLANSELCSVSAWDLPDLTTGDNGRDVVIVSSDTFEDWTFVWEEEKIGAISAPRMGDYNLDGYPDMLIVVLNSQGERELQLLENVECDVDRCGSEATDAERRTFARVTEGVDVLASVSNVIDATFFDIDEDGDLDVLYNSRDDDDNLDRERVGLLYNSLHIDSMFLKAMGSNGACPQWCPSGEKFPEPKPVGVNHPGATFKYTMTDGAGKRRVAIGSQLSQTASGLQLPYCLFGLGRTSSYVDFLFMGMAIDTESTCYFSWQGVIPNAQVAIFPYPYDTPSSWFMLMYIHPSGIFFWVVVTCVVCCAVLGLIFLILHRREQLQDKKEVEEQAHLFL